jgi:LGFP repeat
MLFRRLGWISAMSVLAGILTALVVLLAPSVTGSHSASAFSIFNNAQVQSAVTINGVNVGSPTDGKHWWGKCLVQDFKGGPYGWVIVSYTGGTNIVRNGMLWGWFDNGGATGVLGCPVNQEHGYMNGVRQDFQHGSLYWISGMNHAARIDSGREGAVNWAWNCQPNDKCNYNNDGKIAYNYAGFCLAFVVAAYQNGQHWHLTGGPYGSTAKAYQWWYSRPASDRHPHDTNAPRGAFVIWDSKAARDGSGHIALSLGGGWAISTEFGGVSTVHIIHIASYPAYYLGWVWPK